MNKMTNFNFYGSSVEQFAQREEFIKVYLNNYKNPDPGDWEKT